MPTYCSSYQTSVLTLVFSGTNIGQHCYSAMTDFRRMTEVQRRHNLWANRILLDGSYPAIVWEHTFQVYEEVSDRPHMLKSYTSLSSLMLSRPYSLKLMAGTQTVCDFGNCYFEVPRQDEPDNLLLCPAGIWQLKFVGNTPPTF